MHQSFLVFPPACGTSFEPYWDIHLTQVAPTCSMCGRGWALWKTTLEISTSWRPASVPRRLAGRTCSGYAGRMDFGVHAVEVARRGRFGRCAWNAVIADIKPR